MSSWLALGIMVVLLLFNAFFVAGEFAVTTSRRSHVDPLVEEGRRGATQALYALEHVSLMLAVAQLGVTVMSTSLGVVAEPALTRLLEPPLSLIGLAEPVVRGVSFTVALLIVLFLHVVFGEMVPKNISIARSTGMLLLLAPPMVFLSKLLGPLVNFLDALANWIIRGLGMKPKSEIGATFTVEEVASIVEASTETGSLEDEEGLIAGALQFGDLQVGDLAVPLEQLTTLAQDVSPDEVEAAVARTGFSRFPIVEGDGVPLGYIHLKDILYAQGDARKQPVDQWRIRPLNRVEIGQDLGDVLADMQTSASHLVAVEKGGDVVGVLFLEDVLEELVGRVEDSLQRYPQV